jgi:hypothetical protein
MCSEGVIEGSGVWNVILHSWVGGSDVSKEHAALILKSRMVARHRDAARRIAPSQNIFVAISYVTDKEFGLLPSGLSLSFQIFKCMLRISYPLPERC